MFQVRTRFWIIIQGHATGGRLLHLVKARKEFIYQSICTCIISYWFVPSTGWVTMKETEEIHSWYSKMGDNEISQTSLWRHGVSCRRSLNFGQNICICFWRTRKHNWREKCVFLRWSSILVNLKVWEISLNRQHGYQTEWKPQWTFIFFNGI